MAYRLIVALSLARLVLAQSLVAYLDYGTFQGAYNAEYNISYWQKIPYAAPPVGENSRPWTEDQPLRPVVVTFYGGGFVQGSASFTIPPPAYPILNVSSSSGHSNGHAPAKEREDDGMLFVYPNYRVNAFGFLPGRQVAADPQSDPNAGLLDQEAALRWTQRHIRHFGGDPTHVTIWGQSAGGGSVVAQTIAARQRRRLRGSGPGPAPLPPAKPLFRQALASSPFWPKTYRNEAPEAQWRYDRLANLTGCGGGGGGTATVDSLRCLKQVDVQTPARRVCRSPRATSTRRRTTRGSP
ncbi:secreted lipase [Apiospora hydei]|uniref:Carboxylic ester hydrolase n=1 Tax=Apiospora hydei TaxID=1337664 RepID=A0ABR1X2L1_9PEZI